MPAREGRDQGEASRLASVVPALLVVVLAAAMLVTLTFVVAEMAAGQVRAVAAETITDVDDLEGLVAQARNEVARSVGSVSLGLLALGTFAVFGTLGILSRLRRQLREQSAERERLVSEIERREARFDALVRDASDMIAVVAPDLEVLYESPAVERLVGDPRSAEAGRSLADIVHPDDLERGRRLIREASVAPDRRASGELRMRHADGTWRVIAVAVTDGTADPSVGGVVLNCRDITAQRRLEEQLAFNARHDSLTGLVNRSALIERLDRSLREEGPVALILLDLDDFRSVNDARGHAVGDALLVAVAERISRAMAGAEALARLGGDEFAILKRVDDVEQARSAAESLLADLRVPFQAQDDQLIVRAAIGVALGRASETPHELLRQAEISMYLGKSEGGDRVTVIDAASAADIIGRLSVRLDLAQALERGQFGLEYQPIVDLRSNSVVMIEALLRWRHPELGPIPPDVFVPLAEETGAILPIGRWVLHSACRDAARAAAAGLQLSVSVNVSGRQLSDPGFVRDVAAALDDSGLAAERLIVEITESVFVDDAAVLARLGSLRERGVRIAIDDFGSGYSSLGYMHRFPADLLKVDRSFVAGTGGRTALGAPPQRGIIDLIVEMAVTMGITTVVEGIERVDQLERVQASGTRLGQGFLFAHPMPIDELIEQAHDGSVVLARP